jgi:hypothetical protein
MTNSEQTTAGTDNGKSNSNGKGQYGDSGCARLTARGAMTTRGGMAMRGGRLKTCAGSAGQELEYILRLYNGRNLLDWRSRRRQ